MPVVRTNGLSVGRSVYGHVIKLRGGRCLELGGGKIFKINEKGGCLFKIQIRGGKLLETVVSTVV